MIDLRSDTVTRPGAGMRKAMHDAEVGDDIYGEDPTVIRLQERVAELLGKEAALFVPSGTMANQLGLLTHTRPASEVIVERRCHIFNHEAGAAGWLSGVQLHPLEGARGILTTEQCVAAIRQHRYGEPQTSLICIENTHNMAGGTPQPLHVVEGIAHAARRHSVAMHMDGARLWNASAATGISEENYASHFDTVSVCLSKGLGAPVGSLLAGSRAHVARAFEYRKRLGGAMRQSGVIAAAGLYALEHHRERLLEDHARARRLAECLADLPDFSISPDEVTTNIIIFRCMNEPSKVVVERLREHGVLMASTGPDSIRAVTHLDVSEDDIERAMTVLNGLYRVSVRA